MDSLTIVPGLETQGKLGLVIGILGLKTFISTLAPMPSIEYQLPETLAELLNFKNGNFSIKQWIIEHATQVHSLLVPSYQILGIFTNSTENLFEKKSLHPLSQEISSLLKSIHKVTQHKFLLHLHLDVNKGLKPIARVLNFIDNGNAVVPVNEGKIPMLCWLNCKVPILLDFSNDEIGKIDDVLMVWDEIVKESVVKFVDSKKITSVEQPVHIYTKTPCKNLKNPYMRIKGLIESRAVVCEGTSIDDAIKSVKNDLISTMKNRIFVAKMFKSNLLDESFQLPKRIFAAENPMVCDYLMEHETTNNSIKNIKDLLGLSINEVVGSEIFKPQTRVQISEKKSYFWLMAAIGAFIVLLISLLIILVQG
ncbi:hypothetical protein SteCoe_4945 [Stentor coeruleus]|uniref:Uncharacterized protein n=1 Tax=Stentor coeruleus TaxID=5963 RepID=A0A1R2CTE4_9CILI|nr:hypothetical protein SteCoe_4945 [Stentor coeruleus]